jgi:hypothetical protein
MLIETGQGYVEVVSFYDTASDHYGADIYYHNNYSDSITLLIVEPQYE